LRSFDSEIRETEIRSDTLTFRTDHNLLAELHNESKPKSESLTVLEDKLVYFASKEREQLVDVLPSLKKLPSLNRAACLKEEVVIASNIQTVAASFQKLIGVV
jgi:hypothetical protein